MWDWTIWAALIVVALAGIAALTLFVARARQAWRDARDTASDVLRRLDEATGTVGRMTAYLPHE